MIVVVGENNYLDVACGDREALVSQSCSSIA